LLASLSERERKLSASGRKGKYRKYWDAVGKESRAFSVGFLVLKGEATKEGTSEEKA